MCTCVYAYIPLCMCAGHRTAHGHQFAPFICRFQGSNSGCQAFQQVLSPTESPHWPRFLFELNGVKEEFPEQVLVSVYAHK